MRHIVLPSSAERSLLGEAAIFDTEAAYRITPVRPAQRNALCLAWEGKGSQGRVRSVLCARIHNLQAAGPLGSVKPC